MKCYIYLQNMHPYLSYSEYVPGNGITFQICPFKCHCTFPTRSGHLTLLFRKCNRVFISCTRFHHPTCLRPPFHFCYEFCVGVEVIIDDSMSLFSIILNLVEIILVPFLNTL